MEESFLLKSIHHAGLPEDIAMRDFDYEESWQVGLRDFENYNKEYRQSA